jgi:hypothetical protein
MNSINRFPFVAAGAKGGKEFGFLSRSRLTISIELQQKKEKKSEKRKKKE